MSLFSLTHRVALVTGASSGLGRHFAKVLALQGAAVAVAGRRTGLLEQLATEIETAGGYCFPVTCDISKEQDIVDMVSAVKKEFGRLDILSNNAGIAIGGPSVALKAEEYDAVMNVNARGVFFTAREVAKIMIEQQYGRIINTASMYGLVGNKYSASASYHISKGAVVNMTRALAAEWASAGVTVNALCPGFFISEMTERLASQPAFFDFVKNSCCMERLGKENELDTALLFLAANSSSYITGQMIVVDGGWTCI